MDNLLVWLTLIGIAVAKLVVFLVLVGGGLWLFVWISTTFSVGGILILFGIGIAAVWVWAHTMDLHDRWMRGKIVFPWEKK